MKTSVIIPTHNEQSALPATLRSVFCDAPHECIVVDSQSRDGTARTARAHGARVLRAPKKGRASQLNFGASHATGDVLLFLHADTVLPSGWQEEIRTLLLEKNACGGAFTLSFSGNVPYTPLFAALNNVRARMTKHFFGDSAIFVRRDCFERAGGFPQKAVMEDYLFSREMKRHGRTVLSKKRVRTSPRKFGDSPWRTFACMAMAHAAQHLKMGDTRIAHAYARCLGGPEKARPQKHF